MTKSIKKFTAVFMAVIMVFGMLSVTAFAAGTITSSTSGEDGDMDIKFSYTAVNNSYTTVQGKVNPKGFAITTEKTYFVKFTPTLGASTTICICDEFTNEVMYAIAVPQSSSGMPSTLSTYLNLPVGFYYIKIKSNSASTTTSGSCTIYGVFTGTYN